MIYALRSPTTRLAERRQLAEEIGKEVWTGEWGSLQEELLVRSDDKMWPITVTGFCVYCNTAVTTYDNYGWTRFRHDYHNGGIKQDLCKEIGKLLGMTPVYPDGIEWGKD